MKKPQTKTSPQKLNPVCFSAELQATENYSCAPSALRALYKFSLLRGKGKNKSLNNLKLLFIVHNKMNFVF